MGLMNGKHFQSAKLISKMSFGPYNFTPVVFRDMLFVICNFSTTVKSLSTPLRVGSEKLHFCCCFYAIKQQTIKISKGGKLA